MSLCVWTSLHLNVHQQGKEHLQKYLILYWMILGLLAPEMVIWNAWGQRNRAKELSALMMEKGYMPKPDGERLRYRMRNSMIKVWNKARTFLFLRAEDLPEFVDSKLDDKYYTGHEHSWTDVHSWLVVMGGIALGDATAGFEKFLPTGIERLTLSTGAFNRIVRGQLHPLPDIPTCQVEDKSTSDSLAKMLTCWQASYFCIQCTFRLSQQLSITLLELNVFAHALCALLLFVVWWNKPRDIREPIVLQDEEALDMCAWLAMGKGERAFHASASILEMASRERSSATGVMPGDSEAYSLYIPPQETWQLWRMQESVPQSRRYLLDLPR